MADEPMPELFPETVTAATPAPGRSTGVLSAEMIEDAIRRGRILPDQPIEAGQIQPSSLDLRLGPTAYRVTAGFLPGRRRTVADCLRQQGEDVVEIDLAASSQVLERGHVYIVPLQESLRLPKKTSARASARLLPQGLRPGGAVG